MSAKQGVTDPNANTAFRSFWTAPPQQGRPADYYEYQGSTSNATNGAAEQEHGHSHSHGHSHDHSHSHNHGRSTDDSTPLLSQSIHSNQSQQQRKPVILGFFSSYSTCFCCFIPILLLLLFLAYLSRSYFIPAGVLPPPPIAAGIASYCNPFALLPVSIDLAHHHGLVAYLYTLPKSAQSSADSTNDYLTTALPVNLTFFFSSLDTPTRLFTDVFKIRDLGNIQEKKTEEKEKKEEELNSEEGSVLLPSEYFLLKFFTRLQPDEDSLLGPYQFALISDDGSVLYTTTTTKQQKKSEKKKKKNQKNDLDVLIDNDGIHSTQFSSSHLPYNFSSHSNYLPLELHYFQGPAAHIALQLLYRIYPESEDDSLELNGISGNDLYWKVQGNGLPSIPTDRYQTLIQTGWSVVPPAWFWLPKHYEGQEEVESLLAAGIDPCL